MLSSVKSNTTYSAYTVYCTNFTRKWQRIICCYFCAPPSSHRSLATSLDGRSRVAYKQPVWRSSLVVVGRQRWKWLTVSISSDGPVSVDGQKLLPDWRCNDHCSVATLPMATAACYCSVCVAATLVHNPMHLAFQRLQLQTVAAALPYGSFSSCSCHWLVNAVLWAFKWDLLLSIKCNAMHSIGQSIKSPECPCVRASNIS